jgi:hypothetical protein
MHLSTTVDLGQGGAEVLPTDPFAARAGALPSLAAGAYTRPPPGLPPLGWAVPRMSPARASRFPFQGTLAFSICCQRWQRRGPVGRPGWLTAAAADRWEWRNTAGFGDNVAIARWRLRDSSRS